MSDLETHYKHFYFKPITVEAETKYLLIQIGNWKSIEGVVRKLKVGWVYETRNNTCYNVQNLSDIVDFLTQLNEANNG